MYDTWSDMHEANKNIAESGFFSPVDRDPVKPVKVAGALTAIIGAPLAAFFLYRKAPSFVDTIRAYKAVSDALSDIPAPDDTSSNLTF